MLWVNEWRGSVGSRSGRVGGRCKSEDKEWQPRSREVPVKGT
jgi:hypothetical protein